MAGEEYLGDGRSDGVIIGRSATDKVAFLGSTPVAQRSGSVQDNVASSTRLAVPTSSGAFGFTSSLQLSEIYTRLTEIRATLVALGFWKGAS